MLQVDLPVASPPGPLRGPGLGARPSPLNPGAPGWRTLPTRINSPRNVGIRVAGWVSDRVCELCKLPPAQSRRNSTKPMLLSAAPLSSPPPSSHRYEGAGDGSYKGRDDNEASLVSPSHLGWETKVVGCRCASRKFFIVWDTERYAPAAPAKHWLRVRFLAAVTSESALRRPCIDATPACVRTDNEQQAANTGN